jgi:hypothetical protein
MPRLSDPGLALKEWLKSHRTAYPFDADFAAAAGCTGARLSQILKGEAGRVSPVLAISFHRKTEGAVPGNVWRPDLWRSAADVPVEDGQ